MKRLIICSTYYQVITAVQLKLTIFRNDHVTLWLTDHSMNADHIAKRLEDAGVFDSTEFIHNKHDKLSLKYLFKLLKIVLGICENKSLDFYDEVIFYNLGFLQFELADYYKKHGHKAAWAKLDEGILSYETPFVVKGAKGGKGIRIALRLRRFLRRDDIVSKVKKYYCFFPELKTGDLDWEFVKISPIKNTNAELKRILNYIFEFKPEKLKQRYIFFSSASDIEGNSCNETELVLKIAEKVGKENLLVKMHPRDSRSVYSDMGIAVMKNSYVPWELIQLNWDNEDKVLLTVNSGAFINISVHYALNVPGYFLYNDVKSESLSFINSIDKIDKLIVKLHSLGLAENLTPKSINDF